MLTTLASAAKLDTHLAALKDLPDSPARNTVVVAGGGLPASKPRRKMPARLRSILGQTADIKVIVVDRAPNIGPGGRRWSASADHRGH
jgi:NADH dehydrogenase